MSKKMLKRSLALGALMAFVITGSAMAASNSHSWQKWEDIHGEGNPNYWQPYTAELGNSSGFDEETRVYTYAVTDGVYTLDTKGYAVSFNGVNQHQGDKYNPNHQFHNTNLNGHKLVINHTGSGAAVDCVSYVSSNFHWTPNDPENYPSFKMALPGFKFYTEGESKKGDLEINAGNAIAIGGHGDIDVNTLKITASTSNAINSNPSNINTDSKYTDVRDIERVRKGIVINANDVEITLNDGGNVIQAYNQVTIGSEKDAVDRVVIKGNYERAIRVTGSTTKIYADTFNLDGATESSKVDNNGSLELTVNKDGVIKNQYHSASKGAIDVTLGSGVEWTGKFVTDDNATKGALNLSGTWNLKDIFTDLQNKTNSLTEATFKNGSTFVIDGATYENNDGKNVSYALNGAGENATLTVENGAKLTVTGIDKNIYNIAKGFATLEGTKVDENTTKYWDVTDLNTLMEGKWLEDTENKTLQLEVVAKDAEQMATDTGMSTSTATLVQSIIENKNNANTPAEKAAVEFIEKAQANNSTPEAVGNAINNATKMGEAGGNSTTAASIVKNVTGVTNDRLSFNCGHSAPHKGGHGVGLFEEGSGADIWVEYVHGKDKVEDMPSTAGASSYEGQYNGLVMGVDFKKVNKFQSGIAFNYGEGDTNSLGNAVRTHSDYDFWGVGYYGSIHNDDSNVIFDINYAQTDSDVTQYNSGSVIEASPETTTWSAGVKLEKLYQNENVQIVPYTGLRYMSIDADDYSTKKGEFYYSMDRQDIWLLPLGVSIRQEVANDNGWTVSPRVDLSYIWAFGDTNSNMEVKSPFAGVSQIGYDVMDDGSFLGLVGIEAHKGQWGYGIAYSYQKGDHSESKKWYVDVNYSF